MENKENGFDIIIIIRIRIRKKNGLIL